LPHETNPLAHRFGAVRYFFHTENGRSYPDEHGAELPDVRSGLSRGLESAGRFLREKPQDRWATDFLSVTVSDHERPPP
jgi:hypothetical protein